MQSIKTQAMVVSPNATCSCSNYWCNCDCWWPLAIFEGNDNNGTVGKLTSAYHRNGGN